MRPAPLAAVFALLGSTSPAQHEAKEESSAFRSPVAILISVPDQKLVVLRNGARIGQYPVSTSKFGLGDRPRSYATPLGKLVVAQKVGDNAPLGAVFKGRRPTGEILKPNAAGRDPIVTRILSLRGMEPQNAFAFQRAIYIHGTPEERRIGKPVSYGCIRMKSKDVVKVFESAPVGTTVEIANAPMRQVMREFTASRKAEAASAEPVVEKARESGDVKKRGAMLTAAKAEGAVAN